MKRPEISASYKVTSAPPNSSKKRKSTSDVWNHFIKETDQNGKVQAKCKHCGKCFSGLSKDGTTHLKNHLNSSKCKRSQKETGGSENPTVTNGNFVFDEERSGLDLVRMIIKNGYPLNMVEHEEFIIFMKNLQPTFKLPSQDTLKDKILRFYREEKEKLRKQFDKVLSFSLILNFWTDCGKKSKYCSFTLQFIEDGPKLKKKNIAIKNVEYNYTGETLFEIVKGVLLEWNIDKKLASITVESSYANNQMVKILDRWLGDQGNCNPFRKQIFHIPCITHVINLLVKVGLDEIDYILHKIRKDIKYMSVTTIGKQKFEEVVKKLNLGGKDITSEGVPVRWDSTFFMLRIALELRRQGDAFVDQQSSDCVFPMNLSVEEWDKAKVAHKCLTVFYDAICSFFGSKCLSTNVYFCKIFDIYGSLNQWQGSDITYKMIQKLDCYFEDICYVCAIVAVFDPRTKLDFVEDFEDTSEHRITLGYMFDLYAENLTSQRSSSSFINNDNSSSSDGDDPCNILDYWKKSKRQRTELEKYLQGPLQPDEEFDILGWWHTKSQDSPTLWTMARDILAIPMSTSTSNSAFCIETMTLDPIFNDLDPDIIEALFCGKDWLDNLIRITSNKDNDRSIANPIPMLENPGSTSGPEPLQTGDTLHVWSGTLEPQEAQSQSII
uniref:BED-type domain-containing protein n=1 Tax=Quercus lobata TaxID=97700 RepID=A0A7N2MT18_QUELO